MIFSGGGKDKIFDQKQDHSGVKSKIGSKDNAGHVAGVYLDV